MPQFKNTKQVKSEKLRLRNECNELENKIKNEWKELKSSLRPTNIARQIVAKTLERKSENATAKDIIKEGISDIAGKLTTAAGKKIEKWLKP